MSYEPLLATSRQTSFEMTTRENVETVGGLEEVDGRRVVRLRTQSAPNNDPTAPSHAISSGKQRISDLFTILCAGCALISDGYANSLMTLINVVLKAQHATQYTSAVSTRVSNALLVGEICGQITVG